ncbi:Phospholipid scramblase 1 isoform 5 [Schistosoma japonicum]|uniref:Phospholipid scramblase n=1 Tax=Schistosoma japonicum TaxID=6182 RepID=A0A4Z2CVQ8_SCHJA|nr:Phospholipid scramblase 1 isoform 5 [Schistosoma japonicum]
MKNLFLSDYVEPIEGLHRLLEVDRVTVRLVKDTQGSKLYDAVVYEALLDTCELLLKFVEKSSFAQRFWCGSHRAFDMEVRNINGKLVMHLQRPMRCSAVVCFCCPYEMKVDAPVGEPMGSIVQSYGRFGHTFCVKDWNDNIQLDIKGPWFSYTCCFDLIFKIYAHGHNRSIGRIIRRRNQENDNFRVDFPLDLDYRMKLLLICGAIFLDFVYFETK